MSIQFDIEALHHQRQPHLHILELNLHSWVQVAVIVQSAELGANGRQSVITG